MTSRRVIRFFRRLLPYPLFLMIFGYRDNPVALEKIRRDRLSIDLGGQASLQLYWKVLKTGRGPAVFLQVNGYEVVRFDCFGASDGHYHVRTMEWRRRAVQRLEMPEKTREDQIERALFEVEHNARWYLDRHPLSRVRNTKIDPRRLAAAVAEARETLACYAAKVA